MAAGFTSMSKECKPEQVMEFLNELFSYLDAMLDKHKVIATSSAEALLMRMSKGFAESQV
ncbi:guanylate cyclase domain-containing protein [Haematococcus lacustris]|uniref:Guanylate cyclase domain-containing protein n=1 Tax=Haematococcus lacustris TaxID=44745 RepID=A0A699YWA7_HAELA|nr:guanylate cyclase domain-containing protein [Haematococcus lacustris]